MNSIEEKKEELEHLVFEGVLLLALLHQHVSDGSQAIIGRDVMSHNGDSEMDAL